MATIATQQGALEGHRPPISECTTRGHYGNAQIDYRTLQHMLLRTLEGIGPFSRSFFGTHPLRAEGATVAANIPAEFGSPDPLWQQHGGWRSVQAAQGYVLTS